MNGLIFVSYRRQDTQSATGRLCDKLQLHFGVERVFHDIESIESGADFAETIAAKVAASSVVLAIVGARWLEPGSSGRPRLYDHGDLVRLEIATALGRGIPIIPVLVEGATIPNSSALPNDIAALFDHQAHEISESRWQYDSDRLIDQLEKLVPPDHPQLTGDQSAWRHAVQALTGYAADFVQLLVHPRRHIVALLRRQNLLIRAALFFALSQLLGAWLFVLPSVVASVPVFVMGGVPLGALMLMLAATPLHLAARVVRAPSHALMTFAACAYIESVAVVIAGAGVTMLWTGLEVGDSSIGLTLRELVYSPVAVGERVDRVTRVLEGATGPVFMGTFALAIVLWLYAGVWLFVAAGSFRRIWGISRLRAAGVFVLFALMLLTMVGVVAFFVRFGA